MNPLIRVVSVASVALLATSCAAAESLESAPGATTSANLSATPSPSMAAAVSTSPTASSGPVVPGGLEIDSVAEVVTNDLVVRSLPEISNASRIHPVYLQVGQLLFVLDGPVRADGYDWYEVVPFELCPGCNDTPPVDGPPAAIGWSAAGGKDGEAWIAPSDQPCISPEEDPVHWRPGLMALACDGDRDIGIDGRTTGCSGNWAGAITPGWLAEGGCGLLPAGYVWDGIGLGPLVFQIPPDAPAFPDFESHPRVRITGHLDDAAAHECVHSPVTGSPNQPPEVVYPELAVLYCRAAFVVTDIALR